MCQSWFMWALGVSELFRVTRKLSWFCLTLQKQSNLRVLLTSQGNPAGRLN